MGRDYTKYNLEGLGENLNKRKLVFTIVKDWAEKNNPSLEEQAKEAEQNNIEDYLSTLYTSLTERQKLIILVSKNGSNILTLYRRINCRIVIFVLVWAMSALETWRRWYDG